MIAPPLSPQPALPAPSPPEFYFLGTQTAQAAYLLPSLRSTKPGSLPPLDAFVQAVFFAQDRVWILDPFFDHLHGLPALFDQSAIVESKATFQIISRQAVPTTWLGAQLNWKAVARRFFWQERDHAWFHGRFALVDQQLWHFGSTVGGAYPGFDAATRWYEASLVTSFHYQFKHEWEAGP